MYVCMEHINFEMKKKIEIDKQCFCRINLSNDLCKHSLNSVTCNGLSDNESTEQEMTGNWCELFTIIVK
jgi:hypothetical protein